MRERTRRRIERVREEVHVIHILERYGYDVRSEYHDTEQQFSCDLHGDGTDQKPSGRVYPDGWWYCFGCQEQRDSLKTVQDKEGCTLLEALDIIEKGFDLPPLPFDLEDYRPLEEDEIEQLGKNDRTLEQEAKRLGVFLETVTSEGLLPPQTTMAFWEALDQTRWRVRNDDWDEGKGRGVVLKLLTKVKKRLQGE